MSWPTFPPAIWTGDQILYLTIGPIGVDGDMHATYTARDLDGGYEGTVEIHQGELGGNEAPMRELLEGAS